MSEHERIVASRYEAELKDLENRLADAGPGVLAVIETYARAQAGLDQVDAYARAIDPRPPIVTSNGSAPID